MLNINIAGRHSVFAALESSLANVISIEVISSFYSDHDSVLAPFKKKLKVVSPNHASGQLKEHGIMALVELNVSYSVKEYEGLDNARTVVVLDHLQDPQNLGSAFRHACAFGIDAIVIPKNNAAPLTATVATASVGCLFKVPCILVNNISQAIQDLKKADFGIIGTGLQKAVPFSKDVFWPKSAIVIGSEGAGMSHIVTQSCDSVVKIPLSPACESLNAAVTLALMGYERSLELKLFS